MKSISSLLALVLGTVAVTVGVACEGEPPKTAESATTTVGQLPPPEETATIVPTPSTPEPATTCCQCQCGDAGGAMVAVHAGDAGAVAADAAVAVAATANGEISGDITATPAYLKGASVVYLEDAPKDPTRGMSAHMDNRQMNFSPFVQVVTAGGSVSFLNSDPFPHNVFSGDHGRFDLGLVQPGHSITHKFTEPGAYTLLCNLHPNMIGYVVVSPSSYFAKTDQKGHYVIKDVPAGTYKITAWAPRLTSVTETVTLKGATATQNFELHR